jgi:hemerythrin-like domain-containing protein
MSSISEYLSEEHRHCDDLFVEAENAVSQSRWNDAEKPFHDFMLSTEIHFNREELVLFPAFEQATTPSGGPTEVMRSEHRQIRSILQRLEEALKKRDTDQFLGEAETLLPLVQQHNLKEESMLYRMASQVLANQADTLIGRMQVLDITT